MSEKFVIIDGNSIINRSFYGMPLLSNSAGIYTNALLGFMNTLLKIVQEEQNAYLAVAFDLPAPTFRHIKFEEYKGTRKKMPDELRPQIALLKTLLDKLQIQRFEVEGYEADDILGTIAQKAVACGVSPVIVSGDKDLLQIASDIIKIRIPKTSKGKTETLDYMAGDVKAALGVTPVEFIDVKGLMGDSSDNIPGVPGIGEKTALKIIQQYHCIENAIENATLIKPKKASENLQTYREQALLSKELATIDTNAPVDFNLEQCRYIQSVSPEAVQFLAELELKSLINKLTALSQDETPSEAVQAYHYTHALMPGTLQPFINKMLTWPKAAYIVHEQAGAVYGVSFLGPDDTGCFAEASDDMDLNTLFDLCKAFFESSIPKVTHDVKRSMHLLHPFCIVPNNVVFDTMLAGYLLNPTKSGYTYDDLATEFLQEAPPSEEGLLGKGKSKRQLGDLNPEQRVSFCTGQSRIVLMLQAVLIEQLKQNELLPLYSDIELPLAFVLYQMEAQGVRVDAGFVKSFGDRVESQLQGMADEIQQLAGEPFNINSPKQLGEILFNENKLNLPKLKKNKSGYSTDAETLEKLSDAHPVIPKILMYRTLSKLKSTYVDGLLSEISPRTGKIHTTFNQTIAATGRLSSTEPNLQNIPIRLALGRELRKAFVPDDDAFIFVDGDYSQIELRVLAHIADDDKMIAAFKEGQDIHRLTASQVNHVPYDAVTNEQRSNAKAVNFGIVYGISSFGLAKDLNISKQEAQYYIDQYFETYPRIKQYLDTTIAAAKEKNYAQTLYGRKRAMPELHAANFSVRSFGERVAMNMPIQGTAADIIKIAMLKVYERICQENLKSRLLLQVHDELLVMAHKDETREVEQLLREEMENAVTLKLPLEVDIHVGNTWYDAK